MMIKESFKHVSVAGGGSCLLLFGFCVILVIKCFPGCICICKASCLDCVSNNIDLNAFQLSQMRIINGARNNNIGKQGLQRLSGTVHSGNGLVITELIDALIKAFEYPDCRIPSLDQVLQQKYAILSDEIGESFCQCLSGLEVSY